MFRDYTDTLKVGSQAPRFSLPAADGNRISLESLEPAPALIFFLRGTWCPNCKKLMRRLDADWRQFLDQNVQVLCIAAQRIDGLTRARAFVEQHRYPFPLLFDETRRVTKEWGVYHRIGADALHIAHPAVFLIDSGRTIRWIAVSPNQYTRPSTPELIDAVRSLRIPEEAGP
jgi:peroxiredoxin